MSYFDYGYDDFKEQRKADLQTLTIPGESCTPEDGQSMLDCSTMSESGEVRVLFRGLEQALLDMIEESDYVLGCVAWLTSTPILEALAHKRGVQIVVQKEDFLRPDIGRSNWAVHLRRLYDALPQCADRYSFPPPLSGMSYCGDPSVEAVRCVGNHNADRIPAFPRAHHKFVLFCRKPFIPYAVWTGSFNFTKNAGYSLENAVILTDPAITAAYMNEWAQLLAISEPLDWRSRWVAPQWRIGS